MKLRIEGENLDVQTLLKEQPNLKHLQLYTVRKAEFKRLDGLDQLPLESLELRWYSGPDLTHVPLPKTLKHFHVWHCGKLRSLDGLEAAPQLEELIYDDNCRLDNTDALSSLTQLKRLQLSGSRGSSNHKISSIEAISNLPIEALAMFAIDGKELDLTPITRLKKLKTLDLNGLDFAPTELAKVAAAFPWFFEQLLDLEDMDISGFACKKCNGTQKKLFLQRKKWLWCPSCNQAGIDKALDEFRELVDNIAA